MQHEINIPIIARFRDKSSMIEYSTSFGYYGTYGNALPDNKESVYGQVKIYNESRNNGLLYTCNDHDEMNGEYVKSVFSHANARSNYRPEKHSLYSKFLYAVFAYSGQRTVIESKIDAISEIRNSPFENSLSFIDAIRPNLITRWIANNRTKSALAAVAGDTVEKKRYDQSLRRITNTIKDICDLDVEFVLEREPLNVSLKVDKTTIDFNVLPDGLKSIISWIADLSLRLDSIPWANEKLDIFEQPLILFLDEIDIHLHPRWQRKILPAIQTLLPNSQIFVSTHSPFVVGSVDDALVYKLPEKGSIEHIVGKPTEPGKSYQVVLDEIFDLTEEFGDKVQNLFAEFYVERNLMLQNCDRDPKGLLKKAKELEKYGVETSEIVQHELRQLKKRMPGVRLDNA